MSQPLFELSKCSVPSIPSVDFDFVSDCSIKEPPPPILDCMEPITAFTVVPECPELSGSISLSINFEGCIGKKNVFRLKSLAPCGDDETKCRTFIDLDLAIPIPIIPCPSIKGSLSVSTFPAGCREPRTRLLIRRIESVQACSDMKSKPRCFYDIDIDVDVPIPIVCPSIKGGDTKVSIYYADKPNPPTDCNSITVSQRSLPCAGNSFKPRCFHTIDIDVCVPIPVPPCPSLKSGSVGVAVYYDDTPNPPPPNKCNRLKITQEEIPENAGTSKPRCFHTIDIDVCVPIPVPPCPSIQSGSLDVSVYYADGRDQRKRIKIRQEEIPENAGTSKPRCYHIIDIDLDIPIPPPPCPSIKAGSLKTSVYYEDGEHTQRKSIYVKRSITSSGCYHTIDIDLDIPIPPPVCPSIKGRSIRASIYYADERIPRRSIHITQEELVDNVGTSKPRCYHIIDVDLDIPIPKPPPVVVYGGWGTVYDLPCSKTESISIGISSASTGSRTVYRLKPYLHRAKPWFKRPAVSKGVVTCQMVSCYSIPRASISIRELSTPCKIWWEIDLDIKIPLPPKYVGGKITFGDFGSGSIYIGNDPDCRRRPITGIVTLNTSACAPPPP